MIRVTADRDRKLVIAHMSGFLSPEEVAIFAREEQAAVESMGCRSGEFVLLVNTAEAVIQSQDVVAAFQHLIMTSKYKARRIAIVRENSITKLQTQRIIKDRAEAAVFDRLEDAEAWLFAEDADRGKRPRAAIAQAVPVISAEPPRTMKRRSQ